MAARLRLALSVAVLCAAGIVAVALASSRSGSGVGAAPVRTAGFYGMALPAAGPIAFALRDQDHRLVRMRDLRGRVVAAIFLRSGCVTTCAEAVSQLRGALAELPRPIPALAISVDPAQDTPAHVRAFLFSQQVAGVLRYLAGPRAALAALRRRFGLGPRSVEIVLFDGRGRARVAYRDVARMDPDAIAADIRTLQGR